MPIVTTEVQLKSLMVQIVRDVIEEVSDEVLKEFKKYVDQYVYGWGDPTVYKRTYEFRDKAWDWGAIKQSVSEVTRELYFDGSRMPTHTSDLYTAYKGAKIGQHGSEIPPFSSDARDYMASILDVNGRTSNLQTLGSNPANPSYVSPTRQSYWDKFIDEYVHGGKMKMLLDRTFASHGIKSG